MADFAEALEHGIRLGSLALGLLATQPVVDVSKEAWRVLLLMAAYKDTQNLIAGEQQPLHAI